MQVHIMTSRLCSVAPTIIISVYIGEAQTRTLGVFDFPADARFVSLGSAGTGLQRSYFHFVNPSQLVMNDHVELSYGVRPINGIEDLDARFSYVSISIPITVSQTLGISYDRYYQGKGLLMSSEGPETIGVVEPVEQLFGVSYARRIGDAMSVGLSIKQFRFATRPDAEAVRTGYTEQTANATVADFGLLYILPMIDNEAMSGQLNVGAVFTNLGTWMKFSDDMVQQMPRYFRSGLALASRIKSTEFWQQYSIILMVQYQNALNEEDPGLRDYWSFGAELGLGNVIFLRTDITVLPYTSFFGNRNQGTATYGVGFSLPMGWIASSMQRVHIKFDYAAQPLNLDLYPQFSYYWENVRYNNVYTIRIGYNI